ncbi:MAG: TIR domain-containing protein [Verrucomicrobiota bacterium]
MSDSGKAVFLSYASQDAEAAKRICDALRSAGIEVWFDVEGGLETGDEWDAKIRRQIKECVLFLPIISANTQAREEGYFRIEWELAAQRALGIASGVAFILPVVIDDTREPGALVPDRFRSVQWTRLRGGEMTPEARAKFIKLWSHRTGVLKHRGTGSLGPLPAPEGPVRPASSVRAWVAPAAVGGALLAGAVAYLALKPEPRAREVAPAPAAPARPAEPAPTEARRLTARAFALLHGLEATREDYKLAEEYCQRAIQLDPEDGEAWAAYSQVNAAFVYRGWDASPERKEQTRVMAERAMRLAPDSAEARLAQAGAWATFGINRDEREKLLREVVRDDPANQGALRFLAVTVLARPDGFEECLALNERSAALPGGDPLALFNSARYLWNRGQKAEGYAMLQRALAQRKFASALVLKMVMEINWRGDLTAAETTLREIPPSALQEDRANYHAGLLRYYQRNAKAALEIWQAFPRDYYVDFNYEGPKGLLLGLAYELDGREAAAKIEWRSALQVVEKRIAATPNNPVLYLRQALLLACLGEKAAAGEALRASGQLEGLNLAAGQRLPNRVARVYARLGRFDEIFAHPPDDDGVVILRISPDFDSLRADPRFAEHLRRAGVDPRPAPQTAPPRDWPRNPELKKAIELIEGLESIPDDFALAEQLVKPILDRAPADVEAVTVMARVQSQFMRRGFDRSDERSTQARLYGERALQLDPNEPEAMLAVAAYLFSRQTGVTRAERLLRRAMEVDPGNPRHGRMLADLLNVSPGREAEAVAQSQENARRFPNDVLTRYDMARVFKDQGRYEESDRELDATLALAPLPNAIAWKARFQFGLHNDIPGMKRWLDQVPERVRGTERTVFGYFVYAAFGGDAETGLTALRAFTQKWFTDFEYAGPAALLNACLLERQGKTELARQQYEAALLEAQRMKVADPTRIWLGFAEFWPLLGLDRKEEAKVVFQRLIEAQRRPYSQSLVNGWWFTLIPGALLLGERDTALELLRESVTTLPESRAAFRVRFQLDPRMAPFREDPEIKALLAEPEEKK